MNPSIAALLRQGLREALVDDGCPEDVVDEHVDYLLAEALRRGKALRLAHALAEETQDPGA